MTDKFREECGIFGIFGHPEAANLTYLGLYALQHRGQESVGISTSDGLRLRQHKSMGYVADAFNEETLKSLVGTSAIGHVRYSTAGESGLKNAQPIQIDCAHGEVAVGHVATWSMRTTCGRHSCPRDRFSRRRAIPRCCCTCTRAPGNPRQTTP